MPCGCTSACGCNIVAGNGISVLRLGDKFTITNTGSAGSDSYIHEQTVPATTWNVAHNLDRFPQVTTVDTAGSVVEGDVQYIDSNNIEINFEHPFSGRAFVGG